MEKNQKTCKKKRKKCFFAGLPIKLFFNFFLSLKERGFSLFFGFLKNSESRRSWKTKCKKSAKNAFFRVFCVFFAFFEKYAIFTRSYLKPVNREWSKNTSVFSKNTKKHVFCQKSRFFFPRAPAFNFFSLQI